MKKIVLLLLLFYKNILSPVLHQALGVRHACRYSPTCSEYARIHIQKEGIVRGATKSFARLLYCHPFVKHLPIALQK